MLYRHYCESALVRPRYQAGLDSRLRGRRRRCWRWRRRRWGRRFRGAVSRLVLALLGRARNLRERHVLVEHVVHGQVALGDGVSAAGLVLVGQLVHVTAQDVLGVLVDVGLVGSLAEDGRAAGRAAADAHAREELEGRDDGHREAPAADSLAAEPCPKEASEGGIQERNDAADAGQALDAREDRARDSS